MVVCTDSISDLAEKLSERYEKWDNLYKNGGSDPFYEDGYNLNLVRNHIICYKERMKRIAEENGAELPEIFKRKTPQKTEDSYMARKTEIKTHAEEKLEEYLNNENYLWLKNTLCSMRENEIKKSSVYSVLGYVEGLSIAIKNNDYVTMRRHENTETYLKSFLDCLNRITFLMSKRETKLQPSLFEMFP